MQVEREAEFSAGSLAHRHDLVEPVEGALLGGPADAHEGEDRRAPCGRSRQLVPQRVGVHSAVRIDRHDAQLMPPDPEGADDLFPGVVGCRRDQHHGGREGVTIRRGQLQRVVLVPDRGEGVGVEGGAGVGGRHRGMQGVVQVERGAGIEVERLPEVQLGEGHPAAVRKGRFEGDAELAGGARDGEREIVGIPRDPERLEVGEGAAGGEVPPRLVGGVAHHPCQLRRHLEFHRRRRRRGLGRHVVRIVQHRREVTHLRRERLLVQHVAEVAAAEEGEILLEPRQERRERLGEHAGGVEVAVAALVALPDHHPILGMEVAAPEDVVTKRLDDEALHEVGVLGAGAEEPGALRLAGIDRHAQTLTRASATELKWT